MLSWSPGGGGGRVCESGLCGRGQAVGVAGRGCLGCSPSGFVVVVVLFVVLFVVAVAAEEGDESDAASAGPSDAPFSHRPEGPGCSVGPVPPPSLPKRSFISSYVSPTCQPMTDVSFCVCAFCFVLLLTWI